MPYSRRAVCAVVLCMAGARPIAAQVQPITRADAIAQAVANGARAAIAAADTASANAALLTAREFPNPTLTSEFTKSAPQFHFSLELPFDYHGLRSARIRAAEASRSAALFRFQFEKASAALDADVAYTHAVAAAAHADLARRNAIAADSLRIIAAARRDAGDASDLDVELASIFAGQQQNAALVDSVDLITNLLELQTAMGMSGASLRLTLADSLGPPPALPANAVGADSVGVVPAASRGTPAGSGPVRAPSPLSVAAAEAGVTAAEQLALVERRSIWTSPSVVVGFETHDPSGSEPGILPTVGFSLPLPFFNTHRGAIALANAARAHAGAELALARLESQANIARALRERELALDRIRRDASLVASANRVTAMSLTAYREGASPLSSVLEAQRNAREILGSYIDDLASAWIATATARVAMLTASAPSP